MSRKEGRRGGRFQLGKELLIIKSLVEAGHYHYSNKIRKFVEAGWYETVDLEVCILTATSIHKVEEDELGTATDGKKYTILGRDTQGQRFYTCGKIILSRNDERLYYFITAHEAE
ncbi:MAG: hypothetical protein Q8O86_08150 [Dehalococcoidia bacterium]|nr:hypothetical protein [Dehalococcoidia bacterium]